MKHITLKNITVLFLLLLGSCSNDSSPSSFNQWKLTKPQSEPLYSYSSEDRGLHGDGINYYSFSLSKDYKEYIVRYFNDYDVTVADYETFNRLPVVIS